MPTELAIWNWIVANWPTGCAALIVAGVYVRISRALTAVEVTQKIASEALKLTKRLVRIHIQKYPKDINELMKEEDM